MFSSGFFSRSWRNSRTRFRLNTINMTINSFKNRFPSIPVAWLLLVFSLSLTGGVWRYSEKTLGENLRAKFERKTEKVRDDIYRQLLAYSALLDGAAGLFAASVEVSPEEWATYVRNLNLKEKHPGVTDFRFVNYASIKSAGPELNKTFDMARDTGKLTMSGGSDPVFCNPLFRNGSLRRTVQERRRAILGFVTLKVHTADLVSHVMSETDHLISVRIYDETEMSSSLVYAPPLSLPQAASSLEYHRKIEVGHRIWLLKFKSSPHFSSQVSHRQSDVILLSGLLLGLSLFWITRSMVSTRKIAMQMAEEMTSRLRESNAFLEHVLENIPIMTFIKESKNLTYVRLNKAIEDTLGFRREEMIGKNDYDIFPKEQADFFVAKDREVLSQGQMREVPQEPVETPDRGRRFLHTRKIPILDANGQATHLVGVSEDITERVLAEKEMSRAKDVAESATRAKSAFLASMSHELRTPLNAILSYSELLEEESFDRGLSDFVEDLQKIGAAGKHLLSLINNVLDLSKIEAGKMELYLETVTVNEIIMSVVSMTGALATKRNNQLEYFCPENAGSITTDATKIRQALFNLLSNAFKFTENGVIKLDVQRQSVGGKDWISFSVTDTGIGMSPEQMKNLFNDFSQVFDPSNKAYGGTGLGLSLTRRICHMVGGEVMVTSVEGKGSTFVMRIPAETKQAVNPAAQKIEPRHDAFSLSVSSITAPGGSDILVIEDEPYIQDLMRQYLEKTGFRVRSAFNGEEGLRLAKEIKPSAITLDIMMPQMDGWAFLRKLKKEPALVNVPVVIVSLIQDKNTASSLGVRDYLSKPIDFQTLIKTLKKYEKGGVGPVLVIDDDVDARTRLARILQKGGFSPLEAQNGKEALAVMAMKKPGLIILDLMMPEMSGFEFIVELQGNKEWASIPVIVLTAKDLSLQDRNRLQGQVQEIVQKTGQSLEEFVQAITERVSSAAVERRDVG